MPINWDITNLDEVNLLKFVSSHFPSGTKNINIYLICVNEIQPAFISRPAFNFRIEKILKGINNSNVLWRFEVEYVISI